MGLFHFILALNLILTHAAPDEFRSVFVASVENIDWPLTSQETPEQQRAQLDEILDVAQRLNMNAIMLQVESFAIVWYLDLKMTPSL